MAARTSCRLRTWVASDCVPRTTHKDLIHGEVSKVDSALAVSDLRALEEALVGGSGDVISLHPKVLQEILTGEGVAKVSALAYAGTELIQKMVRAHFAVM